MQDMIRSAVAACIVQLPYKFARSVLVKMVSDQATCAKAWSASKQLRTCDFAFQNCQVNQLRKGAWATPILWQHACDTHSS